MNNYSNNLKLYLLLLVTTIFLTSYDLPDIVVNGRYVNWDPASGDPRFYDSDFYVKFIVHSNIVQKTAENGLEWENEIITAANQWNSVTGSFLNFDIDVSTAPSIEPIRNWEIPKIFAVNLIGFDYDLFKGYDKKGKTATSYLAITATYIDGQVGCSQWYHPIVWGADMSINPFAPWYLFKDEDCGKDENKERHDFRSVILHEFGHAAGFGHHPKGTLNDVMYKGDVPGACARNLTPLDQFAMQRLYGGLDVGQTSSIPCSVFSNKQDGGRVSTIPRKLCDDDEDGTCDCNQKISARNTQITEAAMRNIIDYSNQNLHFNINLLSNAVIDNQSELIVMATSPDPKYAQIQKLIKQFKEVNSPVVDFAFRCDDNALNKASAKSVNSLNTIDPRIIRKENLKILEDLITQVMAHTKSIELKDELKKLKGATKKMEGKTIKEALVYYDELGFFN